MDLHYDRLIRLEGAHNIRDLGGYAVRGGETRWRSILRGDAPHRLSAADRTLLVGEGLRTVIDLRSVREIELEPTPFESDTEIRYRSIPLFGALTPVMTHRADAGPPDMAARYRDAIDLCRDRIAEVMETIAEAEDGMVLFHCTVGKDRTGIIAAILLSLAGADDEVVIADYALTASFAAALIERLHIEVVARGTDPAVARHILASDPAVMRAMLDHLAGVHGGLSAYLAGAGLDEKTVGKLRRRMLADIG